MAEHEPEEGQIDEAQPEVAEAEDVATLKKAFAEEKEKAEGCLANWQRAQADFINLKRRSEQEKEEITRFANSTLMHSLLPILDDLERALAAIPPKSAGLPWVEGIGLIERKLRASLEAQGLSPIGAQGEPFDPYLHEAVRQGKGKEGIVIEEVEKGYKFRDKVIRPAKVAVGNGEEEK